MILDIHDDRWYEVDDDEFPVDDDVGNHDIAVADVEYVILDDGDRANDDDNGANRDTWWIMTLVRRCKYLLCFCVQARWLLDRKSVV